MHRNRRAMCFALCSVLALWTTPTHATHAWDCLHIAPPTWEEYAGDEIQIPIGLAFYGTPVPAGTFISYAYSSWGELDSGTLVTFASSRTSYTSYINYVGIPTTPRSYSIRFLCIVEWENGALEEQEFTSTIVVLANPSNDLAVVGHSFDDPTTVGTETCGYVGLHNTGDGTISIAKVDLDDNDVSVTWADDTEATDFALTAGEEDWIGDPFCFTPNSAGTLTLDLDVTLTNGDIFRGVDTFTITVRNSPCDGVTCSDTCNGDARGYACVPTVVGSSCACQCMWENCNGRNTTEPAVEYCSDAGDIRSRQRITDYMCSGAACVVQSTTWTNDQLVQDCTRGCVMASSTDAVCPCETMTCPNGCETGNVRRSGRIPTISGTSCVCSTGTMYDCDLSDIPPARNEYCSGSDRRYLDTWTDYACASGACSGTIQSSDGFIAACAYACADGGTTTSCMAQPCTLASVTWSTASATEGDNASFSIAHDGACDATICPTYTIIERDPWPNPDDEMASGSVCLNANPKTISWTTTHDDAEFGNSEYDILAFLDTQSIETPSPLIVSPADPCAGVTCPDTCAGDVRRFNGTPTRSGDTCPCVYTSTDCNTLDRTDSPQHYCKAGDELWSHQWRVDGTCTPSACVESGSWTNDARAEDCDSRDNTAAAVPYCRTEDQRWSHAWRQDFICRTNACAIGNESWTSETLIEDCDRYDTPLVTVEYCEDTDEDGVTEQRRAFETNEDYACVSDACDVDATTFLNDRGIESCAYQCAQTTDTTAACIPEPCTLVSVEWDSDVGIYAGTSVTFTVKGNGTCDGEMFSYEIFEDDLWLDDPDKTIGEGAFGSDGSAVVPWITINTWPYRLNDEFGVLVAMDNQEVVTETTLTVYARDPCDDVPCATVCNADEQDTLLVGRHWYDEEDACWCTHDSMDCNTLDTPDGARVAFCAGGDVRSHIRFSDYTCGSGACVLRSADWTDERTDADCGTVGCEQINETTARCQPEPCVQHWACTTWEPVNCHALQQVRECWDESACPGSVRRTETRPCSCALDMGTVTWENPADPEWHDRWTMTVYDGDPVELSIGLHGDCSGHCVDYEIREEDGIIPDTDVYTVLAYDRVCADATLPLTIPWVAMYIGEPIMPTVLTELERAYDDVYAFVTLGENTIRTERELNVRTRTNVLGAASSVFLPYLPTLPLPALDNCFVESLPGTLIGESPPPDCAPWEASLYEDGLYAATEEFLSDVLDAVIGSTRGEVAWTGACIACAIAPALLPEMAGALGVCAAEGVCLAVPVAAAAFCGVVCLDAAPGRAAFATRELMPEILEAQLRRRARELGVEDWRLLRLEVAETHAFALYTDEATEQAVPIWVYARSVPDVPIISPTLHTTWRAIEGGPTALRALASMEERFGRVLIIIGGGTDAPRAAGRRLVVGAAHGGALERNLNDAFDDLFVAYNINPSEATERIRLTRSIVDDPLIYGWTSAPSNGLLPNDMRQISVAVDSIAAAFGDDAEEILIFAVLRHEMSHNSIHWFRYRRGYREVAEGIADEPVDEFFTDVFNRISAPTEARRWDIGQATLRSHEIELQNMEATGELAAMIDDLIRALRDGRRLRGDEWRFLQFHASADFFGAELPTAAHPIIEMLTRALDNGLLGIPDEEVLALRDEIGRLSHELGDDALEHANRVPGSDPDSVLDDLLCRKYTLMENCLTTRGGITDAAGNTDSISGPEDTTEKPEMYDPDDPEGPRPVPPSDPSDGRAPDATDDTGCACATHGATHTPFLALVAIMVALRRRSRRYP